MDIIYGHFPVCCLSVSWHLTMHGENYNVSDMHTRLMHRLFLQIYKYQTKVLGTGLKL